MARLFFRSILVALVATTTCLASTEKPEIHLKKSNQKEQQQKPLRLTFELANFPQNASQINFLTNIHMAHNNNGSQHNQSVVVVNPAALAKQNAQEDHLQNGSPPFRFNKFWAPQHPQGISWHYPAKLLSLRNYRLVDGGREANGRYAYVCRCVICPKMEGRYHLGKYRPGKLTPGVCEIQSQTRTRTYRVDFEVLVHNLPPPYSNAIQWLPTSQLGQPRDNWPLHRLVRPVNAANALLGRNNFNNDFIGRYRLADGEFQFGKIRVNYHDQTVHLEREGVETTLEEFEVLAIIDGQFLF